MVKSIVINAKEWYDKLNGNSYFAGTIKVDDKEFLIPFQHGYGSQYEQEAKMLLTAFNVISCEYGQTLRRYCQEHEIEYVASIKTGFKQIEYNIIKENYNLNLI